MVLIYLTTTSQCVVSEEPTMMVDWTIVSIVLAALLEWAAAVVVVLAVGHPTKKAQGSEDR